MASTSVSSIRKATIGALIEAKATVVTALAECSHCYGSNAKTKVLSGLCVWMEQVIQPGRAQGTTMIVGVYYLGGGAVKQCQLNSQSVTASNEFTASHRHTFTKMWWKQSLGGTTILTHQQQEEPAALLQQQ
jgi:hypothetical protein